MCSFHDLLVHVLPCARRVEVDVVFLGLFHGLRHCDVMLGGHMGDSGAGMLPIIQQSLSEDGTGFFDVTLNEVVDKLLVGTFQRFEQQGAALACVRIDLSHIKVKHIRVSAGETCAEVASHVAENHDHTAGHIFAAVVTDAFDDERCAAVTHGEPFACTSRDEHFA